MIWTQNILRLILPLALAMAAPFAIANEDSCLAIAAKIMSPKGVADDVAEKDLATAVINASRGDLMPVITDQSDLLANAARADIDKRSRALVRMLDRAPGDKELRTFDTVIVGGGPQSAAAASNLDGTRTLVINDREDMGVFSRFGDMFYINSGEFPGKRSPNKLPGARVQVEDLANRSYPSGRVIGNTTEVNLAMSDADFLLGETVSSVTKAPSGSPAKWAIQTSKGRTFYADNVITATGLGARKFPVNDSATLALVEKEYQSGQPRIRFIDDFMGDNQKIAHTGENPINNYSGKRVAFIGKGDGGAIGAESVLGHGPPAGYAYQAEKIEAKSLPKVVHWFGQDAKSGAQYKKQTWERYWDLADEIDSGKINPIPNKVQRIVEIKEGKDKGAFQVFYGPGEKDFEIADEVVFAAGYDNTTAPKVLSGVTADGKTDSLKLEMVRGLPDSNQFKDEVNVAKQVMIDGKPQSLYVAGPATGGLNTPLEAGGINSPRIEVMGTRTAELARQIRKNIDKPRKCLTCNDIKSVEIRPSVSTAENKHTFQPQIKPLRVTSETERNTRIQFRLMNALRETSLPKNAGFDLEIVADPATKAVTLKSMSLSPTELKKVETLLASDKELLSLIASQPHTKVDRGISIYHRETVGAVELDNMYFFNPAKLEPAPFGPSELSNQVRAVEVGAPKGQEMFAAAMNTGEIDPSILHSYKPQEFTTTCGIASSCIILNSIEKETNGAKSFHQEAVIKGNEAIKPEAVVKYQVGKDPGFELGQLPSVLSKQGVRAKAVYADKTVGDGVTELRSAIRKSLDTGNPKRQRVILNFHGMTLGSRTGGHFSPPAAYDKATDSVLVMDTAAHKNEPFWIPVNDLYYSMTKLDSGSGKPRGYILVDPK